MNYEPRGKVKNLIDAMRAAAVERPVWTSVEVAKAMETTTNSVPAFVAPAISHDVLFHKMENGRSRYSLQRFAPAATEAPVYQTAPMAQRETTATGWKPPQMVPPRSIQATVPAVAPSPEPTATPAPAAAAASIPEAASAEDVTWNVWEDGDMDLHGLVELENGGHRMPAEAVARLRKFIAWMPA